MRQETNLQIGHRAGRERRTTLRSYGLSLDNDTSALEEIVALAARLCRKPMAFVSLIEDERQWFIARHGITLRETPIGQSICAIIVDEPGVTVIDDTRSDPRTALNPLCTGGPKIGFYAAAPLRTKNGRNIGTLAVLDHEPGQMAELERDILGVLSRQVMAQLDLRRALRRASVLRREVDHRVKNSLQSVASLTRLQARASNNPEVREALQIVTRRIGTVAALNSELYRQDVENQVTLPTFLGSVIELIRDSAPGAVEITLNCADVSITAERAAAIAIIVNEFATNSFKHAFPDDRPGRIVFECRFEAPTCVSLSCRDDGIGLGSDAPPASGMGLAIIESAVDQLDGEQTDMEVECGHGIRVEFGV